GSRQQLEQRPNAKRVRSCTIRCGLGVEPPPARFTQIPRPMKRESLVSRCATAAGEKRRGEEGRGEPGGGDAGGGRRDAETRGGGTRGGAKGRARRRETRGREEETRRRGEERRGDSGSEERTRRVEADERRRMTE